MNHLASGEVPPRLGNAHPNIVPYQVFETAGGQHLILACGNDKQFAAVCDVLGGSWNQDERFATNPQRVRNRDLLVPELAQVFLQKGRDEWLAALEAAQVPCGAINNIAEALQLPQAQHREMVVDFAAQGSPIRMLGNPVKLSATPVRYDSPPPQLGEHTEAVLRRLGYDDAQIAQWRGQDVI